MPAKVHSCYVGQVNCGPAHDTDGRADDAAALTDEAHAIRVDELLGREPEGPTLAELESFATGFAKSSTFPNPFSKGTNACDITVTFTPRPPDPGGYHLQVGNPGQWKAGPYTADPGPLGMIRLAACPPTQPSCGA